MRERGERRGLTLTATAREKGKGTGKYNSGNGSARRRKRKTRCGPCLPPCDFTPSATSHQSSPSGVLPPPRLPDKPPPPSCACPWQTAACSSGHALRTVHTRTRTRRHRPPRFAPSHAFSASCRSGPTRAAEKRKHVPAPVIAA
ncbi:hypothetical protein IEO21_06641 [Rhodonia placenta]|uniref:Uncharacterized protein n=1 Tax=Rhodonia placenta TaxID=104341 RepID=A0A8H7NZP4_9APHY|nr:hypothetical protein IEO21_06641 [Postia placenta]